MNEARSAVRIRQALDRGLQDISQPAARRLEAARRVALTRQKQEAPRLTLAVHGSTGFNYGIDIPRLKPWLAIAALLLGMWISFYWHSTAYVNELEAIDSALLTDDLPPEAFLDKDFIEWLKDDATE